MFEPYIETMTESRSPDADLVQPFQIEATHLRGRVLRLGPTLDAILARHDYPEPVARLLAETLTLTAMLASMVKYHGVFSLQLQGDGPVGFVIADITDTHELRGYAKIDEARRDELEAMAAGAAARDLLGEGHLAFTVDQAGEAERYQGIVELKGRELQETITHYFRQSEQLDTGLEIEVGHDRSGWCSNAILLQRMPEDQPLGEEVRGSADPDGWRRAMMLLETVTREEMLDPTLPLNTLLFRLFHEDGVRVFDPEPVRRGCRCSLDKVERVLMQLPRAEVRDLREDDGRVHVRCEFCSEEYVFDDIDIEALYTQAGRA